MKDYDPKQIESKWQKIWEDKKVFEAQDDANPAKDGARKPKYYALVEFPYPSGDGLHVGHVRSYTAMDIISRKRRREGYNVLYPIGWDAFGLPAESYAIKTGIQPAVTTKENIENYRKQLKSLGILFDWSREVNTTDPKYYKWTQWLFLKFLEHGLAYKAKMAINWCPTDKIGLANEEVVDGKCERCGTPVEKRDKEQWMLAITKYAERLDKDLDTVDFPERVKTQQRNWIGKSEGAEIEFDVSQTSVKIKVFTTRPDTIFGATFIAVHGTADKFTGKYVTNPATKEKIPVWEAEYVMEGVGTGAVMGVPADDERDKLFAEKYGLPIVENYKPAGFEDFGKKKTTFKLRDWIFSRQRYWGEPIPVIHCEKCGIVPVPEKDLPVLLPEVENYQPTDTGESPLANISDWVNVDCPKCGGPGKRETDTMPNWAGSSWYFLAYCMNKDGFENQVSIENWKLQIENFNQWMAVDWYNGGMEHTTLHLLYSRFWNKFFFDIGLVPTSEPYKKRTSHGLILAEGGVKMSKSLGNVINPDSIVERYGADTLRVYEMFMGPFEQAIAWNEDSLVGPRRFLEKVWKLKGKALSIDSQGLALGRLVLMNQTIKKVSTDIETLGFNTAISALMIFVNALEKQEKVSTNEYEVLLKLLNPFAPHMTEELWKELGHEGLLGFEPWPDFDEDQLVERKVTIGIQVNGKLRATMVVDHDSTEQETRLAALTLPELSKWLESKETKKVIVVLGKIVNIVV